MGHSAQTPRWRSCASSVNANYGMAVSFEYVKRHFHEHARQKVRFVYLIKIKAATIFIDSHKLIPVYVWSI